MVMKTKVAGIFAGASLLAACQPLETMQAPDWAKVAPTPTEIQVAEVEPRLHPSFVEANEREAEVIVEVMIRMSSANDWSRYSIPMKRQLGRRDSLPSFNLIGDGWDPDGAFTGGSGISIDVLDASDEAVTVSVSTYWVHSSTDEGQCEGEVHVSIGSRVKKVVKGGCEVEVRYSHPIKRSNYPLQPAAGGRCGVDSPGTCARRG